MYTEQTKTEEPATGNGYIDAFGKHRAPFTLPSSEHCAQTQVKYDLLEISFCVISRGGNYDHCVDVALP